MKYLYLYKIIAPKDPKTGKIVGMKFSNLEPWTLGISVAITAWLTIWALHAIAYH